MKKYISMFAGAVLAGLAIGVGGTVFLSLENKTVGALMFSVGLYLIVVHALNLFTGKVGYLLSQPASYLVDLLIIWFGNFVGTGVTALAVRMSRIHGISEKAAAMCEVKTADSLLSLFLLAIFCGLLMYGAVEGYKRCQNPILLYACVSVFILCGFEHCIADMFYFSLAGSWSGTAVLDIVVITLGNALGGILLPLGEGLKAGS